jgi:enterochelin esterase family protein
MTYVRGFSHQSKLLAGNAWGDPHERTVHVYLPPNYSDRRKDPYAVVFMLAGWSGRGAHYLADGGAFSWSLPERLDQLINSKQMPPAIVVFPDCATRLGASQYVNSPVNGPYMDYLCDELVDWVDGRFHTHKSREYRGVIGHSSGGFGALVSCMMRSDRFAALCSSAGDTWYEYLYTHTIPTTVTTIKHAGGVGPFVDKFLGNPNPRMLLGHAATLTMLNLSMCSCYLPNANVPHIKGDLWFDLESGAILEQEYKRLLAWDPIHMVKHHVTELRSLRWIHLEAGDNDEYGLQLGHRQLAAKLAERGVAHVLDEYPGKHGGHHYRMPDRIARMIEALGAK